MTKSDWLSVAMVVAVIMSAIATLAGPILAVYAQSRISQQRPKLSPEQPGNIIQAFWRYLNIRESWPLFAGTVLSLTLFTVGHLRAKNHFDRQSVVLVVLGIGGVFYFVTFFLVFRFLDRLRKAIEDEFVRKRKR